MDLLRAHLGQVRVPSQSDKVYKDECCFTFDNPDTDTGLYVSLTSFLGLGRDFVERYFNRTGHAVFLHLRREKEEVSSPPQGDGPEKKITRLAIGVEGGFNADSDAQKYKYTDHHSVVVLPGFVTIPWPNVELPEIVRQSVQAILDLTSASKLAELEALSGTWDGEALVVSKHAENLQQLDNGVKISPSGWKCEKCDMVENLWLNLTDGSILCGRKYHDGSGGNNHAVEHYGQTKHPLAVKLGTITKEGKADVFSYPEDDLVEDPHLIKHLAHWGINIQQMEKTDKSMLELDLDYNLKTREWAAITEQLKPIFGPGYTGLTNMGNSCYLSSAMQMLFVLPDFVHKYYDNCQAIFEGAGQDPAEDFNVQMAKLGYGLLSGKYSTPPPAGSPVDADPPGICPQMFKNLVGKGHPDFSTKRQQDVQDFLLHIFTLLERHTKQSGGQNPGECFKFKVEEKYQCGTSKKVKYVERSELILPLMIPLEAAVNKEEVAAYEAKKAQYEAEGKHLEPEALVRPKIKFFSCLEMFRELELIQNFYSTAIAEKVTARKTTRLATFPDFLLIQLRKFMLREDWVPIKLDVSIEIPDILDLSCLKSDGVQPGEELLPEPEGGQVPAVVLDEGVIAQLADMGFPGEACKKAVYFTQNSGLEPAAQWLMEHCAEADFGSPFVIPGTENSSKFTASAEHEQMIISMGFTKEQAHKALKATDNNIERAMDWIFSHQDELDAPESPGAPKFRDGDSKYKLIGFITHMGTSSMVGHYVVHLLKNGQWVIFNDNKVALSENPPKDLGYMYLYERL